MKYTPELAKQICDYVMLGCLYKEAAAICGITEETLQNWKRPSLPDGSMNPNYHADFANGLEHSRLSLQANMQAKIIKAASHDWRAAAWWKERTDARFVKKEMSVDASEDGAKKLMDVMYGKVEEVEDDKPEE